MSRSLKICVDFGGVLSVHDRGKRDEMQSNQGEMQSNQGEMQSNQGEMQSNQGEMREKRGDMQGKRGIIQGEHISTDINMLGALESLYRLKQFKNKFIDRVELYLLSFAGKKRSFETLKSIEAKCPDLFDRCYFVKHKLYKKLICNHLGADLFIDDTLDIVEDVAENTSTRSIWFRGDPSFPHDEYKDRDTNVLSFMQWDEMVAFIEALDWDTPQLETQELTSLKKYIYNVD